MKHEVDSVVYEDSVLQQLCQGIRMSEDIKMKRHLSPNPDQTGLFRSSLDNQLNINHEPVRLSALLDWSVFDDRSGVLYQFSKHRAAAIKKCSSLWEIRVWVYVARHYLVNEIRPTRWQC